MQNGSTMIPCMDLCSWVAFNMSSYNRCSLSWNKHRRESMSSGFLLPKNFTRSFNKAGYPPTSNNVVKWETMILTKFSNNYNERQICLIDYLKSQMKPGSNFFKSKYIAKDTGLSSKEVGTNMAILSEICPEFKIERYSYSNSTTWLVTTPQV